jgi:hypothetical protein
MAPLSLRGRIVLQERPATFDQITHEVTDQDRHQSTLKTGALSRQTNAPNCEALLEP